MWSSEAFVLPLPPEHRFPMQKYRLLRELLVERGILDADAIAEAPAATDEQIERVHDPHYWRRVVAGELDSGEIRRLGFPWSAALVERSRRSAGATVAAARAALEDGFAANLAGGTHHAFRDHGEAFCLINDIAIAARALQAEGQVQQVLVVDLDVHQGNGTAAIFRDDPSVFTLSLHGERNYPAKKDKSDLDVALLDGCNDQTYLSALESALGEAQSRCAPQLVLYLAGADPWQHDRLGRLGLTREGLARRDRVVFERCRGWGVPVAVAMGGGYGDDPLAIAEIHAETVAIGAEVLLAGTVASFDT